MGRFGTHSPRLNFYVDGNMLEPVVAEYHGDDRVVSRVLWNDGALTEAHEIPVEEVPNVDQDQAEAIFREALDAAHAAGEVGDILYAAFGGDRHGTEDDRGNAGGGPQQSAGNTLTQDPAAGGVSASGYQTQTAAFRKWFRSSNVVDEHGEPMRLYHGTTADIDTFNLDYRSADGVPYNRPAVFATPATAPATKPIRMP